MRALRRYRHRVRGDTISDEGMIISRLTKAAGFFLPSAQKNLFLQTAAFSAGFSCRLHARFLFRRDVGQIQ